MMMDDDLCHLCFESCAHMKYSFQNSAEHTNIQEFIDAFCQLVFQVSTIIHKQYKFQLIRYKNEFLSMKTTE